MEIRSCTNCHCLSNEDFTQVANLKGSGLIIYIHYNKLKQKRYYGDHSGSYIILHNTSSRDIKRFDYIVELCQYKTKCLKCKMLIQRVRNVIDEISIINKNDVIGVCDFCKRWHEKNKCKRCQYVIKKFVTDKAIRNENREIHFKLWLSKLQQILFSISESNVICKHNISLESECKTQLYNLLNYLNSPVPMRQPKIDAFPELFDRKETDVYFDECEKILQDLVTQLEYKESKQLKYKESEDSYADINFSSSESASECICKYFLNNKSNRKPAPLDEIVSKNEVSLSKFIAKENDNVSTIMTPSEHQKNYKLKPETFTESSSTGQKLKEGSATEVFKKTEVSKTRKLRGNKENDLPKQISKNDLPKQISKNDLPKQISKNGLPKQISKNDVKKGTEKRQKEKQSSEHRLILELLKEREKERKVAENFGKSKRPKYQLPVIKDLPKIKRRIKVKSIDSLDTQISDSILECKDAHLDVIDKMIKGTKIVHLPSNYRATDEGLERLPLLFKIEAKVTEPTYEKQSISLPIPKKETKTQIPENEIAVAKGILRYELSNREFIEKGLTKLPSTKVMRRMNIYKMLPASDKYDWFKTYNKNKTLFYNTGERFAEINDTGGGKWFYKNGNVALDGHTDADSNVVKRYVIYSSGEETDGRKKKPITILACFDYFGNGVVYDDYGNVRLKYNQSEGLVADKNICTPGRWKWHTLNDPPVLQHAFINTYDNIKNNDYPINLTNNKIQANEEMIAIELDNFLKEKAHKLMQKFKPFQIRIKALKINDSFSLRIVDQANIFLLFRCDGIYFKISIGMLLKSREIIDTDIAEMAEVSTPYDVFPPRSPSLVNIHKRLSNIRKHYNK